jgi:hypothetical protein
VEHAADAVFASWHGRHVDIDAVKTSLLCPLASWHTEHGCPPSMTSLWDIRTPALDTTVSSSTEEWQLKQVAESTATLALAGLRPRP